MQELGITRLPVPERRAASFTEAYIAALLSVATGTVASDPTVTSAVETAAQWWGRSLALATVEPAIVARAVSPAALWEIGGALARKGAYLAHVASAPGGFALRPAWSWDVRGDQLTDWTYRVDLPTPSGTISRTLAADEVLHVRLSPDPARPWVGRSPLMVATETGRLLARLERGIADEAGTATGQLQPLPEGATDEGGKLSSAINALSGKVALPESVAGGWGDRAGAPQRDWNPKRLGAQFTAPQVALRNHIESCVLGLYGIHPALVSSSSDGTAQREAWRRFTVGTVEAVALVVGGELSTVFGEPVSLTFGRLHANDINGRARAYRSMVDGKIPVEDARRLAGLD